MALAWGFSIVVLSGRMIKFVRSSHEKEVHFVGLHADENSHVMEKTFDDSRYMFVTETYGVTVEFAKSRNV